MSLQLSICYGNFYKNKIFKKIRDKYSYLNYGEKSIKSFLKESSYKTILDIGCGNGRDLILAKRYKISNQIRLCGIDMEINKDLKRQGIELFKLNIEIEKLPFPCETFDLIIANQILEHVKEIFWISNEICRVLKKNGRLIIGVPNLAALHNRLLLLLGKHPSCIKTKSAHVRGFTVEDLVEFYGNIGGLKLKDLRGENLYPFFPLISKFFTFLFPTIAVSIFLLLEKEIEFQNNFIEYLKNNKLETPFYNGK